MQERAGGQVRALESADALDDLPEGVTPAQFLGDNVLMAQEARLIADNPDLGNANRYRFDGCAPCRAGRAC
jgi:hypothetical protein